MKKDKRIDVRLKSITIDTSISIGLQMREFRKFLNISDRELAEIIGCHYTLINYFENPKNSPGSLKFLLQYAKALGVKELKIKL